MLCREQLLIPVQEIIRSNIFAKCVAFWVDCRAEEGRVGCVCGGVAYGTSLAWGWRTDWRRGSPQISLIKE